MGRDVAALVGSSLLNLVDSVIREQGILPLEKRRGALVVVDEMQTMPGVDYEAMLSELGKFGASFVLATQSLAKLDDLSPTMRDTLLANVGCLAVFQVAGSDARQLIWEMDRGRVSEEDMVSLPVHHCYVRATVGKERMPTFSMMVRKPDEGDPETAARIRALASSYVTSGERIAQQQTASRKRVQDFQEKMASLEEGKDPSPDNEGGRPEAGWTEAQGPHPESQDHSEKETGRGEELVSHLGYRPGHAPQFGCHALHGPAGDGSVLRNCRPLRYTAPWRAWSDGGWSPPSPTPRSCCRPLDGIATHHAYGVRRLAELEDTSIDRAASPPSHIRPVETGPAGAAGRRGRNLPPCFIHRRPGRPPVAEVVQGGSSGYDHDAVRRQDRRRSQAGAHR